MLQKYFLRVASTHDEILSTHEKYNLHNALGRWLTREQKKFTHNITTIFTH